MPGRVNLAALEKSSTQQIHHSLEMYSEIHLIPSPYPIRWASQFAAVELHAIWERYAEKRLIAALNHNAAHFLEKNEAKGVKRVPLGLASYIVRSWRRFFDFKSSSDLISIGDRLLSGLGNPFRGTDRRSETVYRLPGDDQKSYCPQKRCSRPFVSELPTRRTLSYEVRPQPR